MTVMPAKAIDPGRIRRLPRRDVREHFGTAA